MRVTEYTCIWVLENWESNNSFLEWFYPLYLTVSYHLIWHFAFVRYWSHETHQDLVFKWNQWPSADLPTHVLWSHGAVVAGQYSQLVPSSLWHGFHTQGLCIIPINHISHKSFAIYCILYHYEGKLSFYYSFFIHEKIVSPVYNHVEVVFYKVCGRYIAKLG